MVTNAQAPSILDQHPALQRKLFFFTEDYGLRDMPAFVWQARPIADLRIDVAAEAVGAAFRSGVPTTENWVGGFTTHERPTPVFDGLASLRNPADQGWIAEVHADGHVIAGLWNFPENPHGQQVGKSLFPWHAELFQTFGRFTQSLYAAAAFDGPVLLTVTIINAKGLHLAFDRQHFPRDVRPVSRNVLQWNVVQASACAEVADVMVQLAVSYARLFGELKSAG